jgi:hypothetical protein
LGRKSTWPRENGGLSRWMHRLMTTDVRRYLRHYHPIDHVWQGGFNLFRLQKDEHPLTVLPARPVGEEKRTRATYTIHLDRGDRYDRLIHGSDRRRVMVKARSRDGSPV